MDFFFNDALRFIPLQNRPNALNAFGLSNFCMQFYLEGQNKLIFEREKVLEIFFLDIANKENW